MSDKFQKSINTLLGYCKAKGKWEVGFDDPPYEHILPLAQKHYGDLWSFDLFDSLLTHHLSQIKGGNAKVSTAREIIDDIRNVLHQHMQDVLIIVPLKGAWIPSSVIIGNLAIVQTTTGTPYSPLAIPLDEIIKEVVSITGFAQTRITQSIAKIRSSRSKDFLSCPLLIIKRYGQYSVISDLSYFQFNYINRFIRLLASYNKITQEKRHLQWIDADHFFCMGRDQNYHHQPIKGSLSLNYNLTFLTHKENQIALKKIIDLFEIKKVNELQTIYFRSMKFYSGSLINQEASIDAISQQLLNTLIAAETLLIFTTRGEKKSKLAHIIIGLTETEEANKSKFTKAIIEAYSDRSSLMHSGKQDVSKYMLDRETEKRESESLHILTELMAHILIKFPDWYDEIATRDPSANFLLLWQEKIKAYIPAAKYTFFQKSISHLIVFLQKISKVKTDS